MVWLTLALTYTTISRRNLSHSILTQRDGVSADPPSYNWMFTDPLGNLALMTDNSGNVTATCDSTLFGANSQTNSNPTPDTMGQFVWGCASGCCYQTNDAGSGPNVYQIGARVYDPGQGRWMQ